MNEAARRGLRLYERFLKNGWAAFKNDFVLGGDRPRFLSQVGHAIGSGKFFRLDPDDRSPRRRYDLLFRAAGAPSPSPPRHHRSGPAKTVALFSYLLLDDDGERPTYGGGQRVCTMLAELLKAHGCQVTLFQLARRSFTGEFYGFPVIGIPRGEAYAEFAHGAGDAFYDATVGFDRVIYLQPELASARRVRPDVVLVCHGIWFDRLSRGYERFRSREWFEHLHRAFARPEVVVSVDTNTANVLRAFWPELPSRMHYLPNFADTRLFHPPAERRNDPLRILFPRRSTPTRGSRLMAEILERIPHDCRIEWVGEGDAEDGQLLRELARADPRFSFATARFEEMPAIYRRADLCVIPTVASEGTSLSCLEGLASGCATIATDVGGLPDLIQPSVNGLLVAPTAPALADAINHLLTDGAERARLQAAGRESSLHFDVERWKERWLRLFRELEWLAR